ncbi:unnamed protein product [Cyprideis torosa]|uniref:[acyl-carrier-protein] S-malonyltransferase n=1 Tax=Cyprideis torosa TaxID=163714 RepID=A0A7R8ZSB6_9CRUS|nr:unnamed protein product [Cyprideis torosa]CAG0901239.1 unnamed protein product [Cyprideis torosa]
MANELNLQEAHAKEKVTIANDILGFDIFDLMTNGSAEQLKQTNVTQPAIFLHSVFKFYQETEKPGAVAGHSLGEFSSLVANGVLSFEDALTLVKTRANAMQKACEMNPGTMAAILGLEDEKVEQVCEETDGIVVAANYNCPGQLVISGELKAVEVACEKAKEKGAKRALMLPVGGAFHSPLMKPAEEELATQMERISFNDATADVYQNITGLPTSKADVIKANLIAQLTGPVKWTQTIQNMITDGYSHFTEVGPGKTLKGLIMKIDRNVEAVSVS